MERITATRDERREILKAGGTPPPRAESNGAASNGKPKGRRGNEHTRGRFGLINNFARISANGISSTAGQVWVQLWVEARDDITIMGHGQIANRLGISRATAKRGIKELVKSGLLEIVAKGNSFQSKPNTYRVHGLPMKGDSNG
jgi:predicted HTH transcriptional regulator